MKAQLYFNHQSVSKAHQQIRLGFIRKVYGLLTSQFLITLLVGLYMYNSKSAQFYLLKNPGSLNVALFGSLVLMGLLYFKRHSHPTNLILLFSYTLCQAFMIGSILIFYKSSLILKALSMAVASFIGLVFHAMNTDRDYSQLRQILSIGVLMSIAGGFIQIFYPASGMEFGLIVLGTVLFCGFILYDIQLLMNKLSPEEYVLATINLYMDGINLFLHILKLLKATEKKQRR